MILKDFYNGSEGNAKGFYGGYICKWFYGGLLQWDFKGFLKGLHKDGFPRIVMKIPRGFL